MWDFESNQTFLCSVMEIMVDVSIERCQMGDHDRNHFFKVTNLSVEVRIFSFLPCMLLFVLFK